MIDYSAVTLPNGLRVVVHRDHASQMSAVNMLYCVGARDESPERTGFAHLFEHLMFRGTVNIPVFDTPVQMASGENNAFTNNDYTDFYITLPKDNIETALWLEADRMTGLNISPAGLQAEKRVVIEEYNQRYLNQPYGEQWLLLRPLIYHVHPYRWPTIGITPDHIAGAKLEDVTQFYRDFYNPSNAILSIVANLEPQRMLDMAADWFGDLPAVASHHRVLPVEPPQNQARRLEVERKVPATMITIAFKTDTRISREHYIGDLMTDLLAGGTSARLYRVLVKERKLFLGVDASVSGDLDMGILIVMGQLAPGVSVAQGEQALWEQLRLLQSEPAGEYELEKIKNKFEADMVYGELNVMNKAMNLGFYTMLGDTGIINSEVESYRSITSDQVMECAGRLFAPERSSTLVIVGTDG